MMLAMEHWAHENVPQASIRPVPLRMLQIQNPCHQKVEPEPHGHAGAENLKENEQPKPKKGLIDNVKPVVAHDRQIGLRMVDAMERPEESIGVFPPVVPVTDEIRNQNHHNHLQRR